MAKTIKQTALLRWGIIIACVGAAALMIALFFAGLPIENTGLALDWRILHWSYNTATFYGTGELWNPPWAYALLLPVLALPVQVGWGLLVFFTLSVLVASVPAMRPRWRYWLGVALLVASRPSLMHFADGNFEGLVLAGMLLVLHGYARQKPLMLAIGALLAVIKPQNVVLLMVIVALYMLQSWPWRMWLKSGLWVGALALLPMLWLGGLWIDAMFVTRQGLENRLNNISLNAALNRVDVPSAIIVALWLGVIVLTLLVCWRGRRTLAREKVGLLVAASLLIAPYANGHGVVTLTAMGLIPLFQKRFWLGLLLIALTNAPYFFTYDMQVYVQTNYWAAFLLLTWAILLLRVYGSEVRPATSM